MAQLGQILCLSLFIDNDTLLKAILIAIVKLENDIDQEVTLLPDKNFAHEKLDIWIQLGLNILGRPKLPFSSVLEYFNVWTRPFRFP